MNKPRTTFLEGVKTNWRNELQRGDPVRLLRLVRDTVIYTAAHLLFSVLPHALIAAGKRWHEKENKRVDRINHG